MRRRALAIIAILLIGGAWFFVSPWIGLSTLAKAIASRDVPALEQRLDFTRLGRSIAPQVVWAYLNKTGRSNEIGRFGSSMIAGASASIADPILGELLTATSVLNLLGTAQPRGRLHIAGAVAALPGGEIGSLLRAIPNAEYGIGHFYLNVPTSAPVSEQYRLHLQVLRWNWKLVGIDLPEKVRDQMADELIRRIGR
jgi:Protein of unknown function (DUF2939)